MHTPSHLSPPQRLVSTRVLLLGAVAALLSWFLVPATFAVTYNERPWWAERSSFVEGDTLYAVGVASHVTTVEEGRQKAYENGKREIQNFRQSVALDDLQIMTQMTYEERNQDGTFSVFRLLRVPVSILGTLPKRKPSTPADTPSSPPAGPSRNSSIGPDECGHMPYSREQNDCYSRRNEALRAKVIAEAQATKDADDQQLAQKNPGEYQNRMALRAAARRVEAEKAEMETACYRLRKGFTVDEVELVVGKASRLWEKRFSFSKGPEAEYLGGRLHLAFNEQGRLEAGNCALR